MREKARVHPSFSWWEGEIRGDPRSFAQVVSSPPTKPAVDPNFDPPKMREEGFGASRHGHDVGRFNRGEGRGHGDGGGHGRAGGGSGGSGHGRESHVWTRKTAGASSSNVPSRSDETGFERWEKAAGASQDALSHQECWGFDGGDKSLHNSDNSAPHVKLRLQAGDDIKQLRAGAEMIRNGALLLMRACDASKGGM
ncbi:5E5 antigen isoform X1 [Triticum aestivum]|uniref:5E5 antigen isoform X1 n=1 Tax=Triticum aestivum TaxID=4565 RepID=UPI001D022C54|nr:5E5 antigen-like isoform X1 [Triticum aestivum]